MNYLLQSAFAGGCAGIVVDVIYFPIETIKTRIQASNQQIDYTKAASNVSKYKGLLSQVSVSFPYAFLFFFSYDKAKQLAENVIPAPIAHIFAASCGELTANAFKNPFEVIKNQMQVGLDPSIRQTIKSVFRTQGFFGFYAGFSSILLREIPFSCIQFPIYEALKKYNGNESYKDYAINGATAGGIAALLTTPFDVVKSKLMTQRSQFYSGFFDCVRKVNQSEGTRGFFRAAHIRTLQISTSGILFFGAYEHFKKLIRYEFEQ